MKPLTRASLQAVMQAISAAPLRPASMLMSRGLMRDVSRWAMDPDAEKKTRARLADWISRVVGKQSAFLFLENQIDFSFIGAGLQLALVELGLTRLPDGAEASALGVVRWRGTDSEVPREATTYFSVEPPPTGTTIESLTVGSVVVYVVVY